MVQIPDGLSPQHTDQTMKKKKRLKFYTKENLHEAPEGIHLFRYEDGTFATEPPPKRPEDLLYSFRLEHGNIRFTSLSDFDNPAIEEYANSLTVDGEKETFRQGIEDRRKEVESHASPSGVWYLFFVSEGIDLLARRERITTEELEYFATNFFKCWNSEGKRKFTPIETAEIGNRQKEIFPLQSIQLGSVSPTLKTYDKHEELGYYKHLIFRQLGQYHVLYDYLNVDLNAPQTAPLLEDFYYVSDRLSENTGIGFQGIELPTSTPNESKQATSSLLFRERPDLPDGFKTYIEHTHTILPDGRINWEESLNKLAFVSRYLWYDNKKLVFKSVYNAVNRFFAFDRKEIELKVFRRTFHKEEAKNKDARSFGL